MKTIGLLGGMSWESTLTYYQEINAGVKQRLGGLHSAQIVLYSVDFDPIEKLQHRGDWEGTARILSNAAQLHRGCRRRFFPDLYQYHAQGGRTGPGSR